MSEAEATQAARELLNSSTRAVLRPLVRSFATLNPGGEIRNPEAQRQLISFCASLRNTGLQAPPALRHMKTLSVLTPR